MSKLKLKKNIKYCEFKYRGQKFLIIETKLNFPLSNFRVKKNRVIVLYVDNSKFNGIKRSLAIHKLIKNTGLKTLIPSKCSA